MYVVPVIGTDDSNENPKVLFVVTVLVTVNAKNPSAVKFVPPIDAFWRNDALGAVTPEGSAASYVSDAPVADDVAGSVTALEIPFDNAGNVAADDDPLNETAVVVEAGSGAADAIAGCWGAGPCTGGALPPPPPQPANTETANAKKMRFVNVRSQRNRAISDAARPCRACAVPAYVMKR
jgi:hypothetical protein